MLKYNYCWDLMDSKIDGTKVSSKASLGEQLESIKVSNNRDCVKVHVNNASKNASFYKGRRRPFKIKNIGYFV